MNEKRSHLSRVANVRFSVGQHATISKEKMRFANGSEKNYTDKIF